MPIATKVYFEFRVNQRAVVGCPKVTISLTIRATPQARARLPSVRVKRVAVVDMGRLALFAILILGAVPAAAQVRVVVDGRVQDVPAGVVRTISYQPGGRQSVIDQPFAGGAVAPGAASITTTETSDEDERGRVIRTSIVTRIEPIAAAVYAPPPGYAFQPAIYAAPQPAFAPRLEMDAAALDMPAETGKPRILRVRRDAMTGHFVAAIRINGVEVRAIVDTGAQETVLSARDARATGATRDVIRSTPMTGIGGTTMLDVTRVRSMEVAGQQLGGFTACIGQEGIPYTLLGQTEIARLGRIVIEDGVMTITPRGAQVAMR